MTEEKVAGPRPRGGDDRGDEVIIRFAAVSKSFGRTPVLEGVDLAIRKGESLVILGGSGEGKSVMLRLLIGLLRPDAGSITIDGDEVTVLSETEWIPIRRRVGVLFQSGALFDSLTVFDNIAFPLREQGVRDEERITSVVAEKLRQVGLPGIENLMPVQLSGGMRKRVALARAVAMDPEIVLYDEPTTGLDPVTARRIAAMISALNARLGCTSITVTHDMETTFKIASRIAFLSEGRVMQEGTPEEIRRDAWGKLREFLSGKESSDGAEGF